MKDYIIQREAVVYRKEDKLGEGAFGAVYKGNFYGATVAVKVLKDPSREKCTEFEREMKIAASLHHPNVVQVYGAIMEGNVAIVMEYLDLTLEDFIKQSDKNRRDKHFKSHALGVAKGLLYLHSKTPPVMHRDLHLGNVLLKKVGDDEYEVKIGDLGSANTLSKRIMTPDRGTPAYAAPENKTRDQQTPKVSKNVFLGCFAIFNSTVDLKEITKKKVHVHLRLALCIERKSASVVFVLLITLL